MIKYSYGSSRGNKIWINCLIKELENSRNYINIAVELNKDNSKSKINWIIQNTSKGDKDLTLEDVRAMGYDNDFIKEVLEFANEMGYTRRWLK